MLALHVTRQYIQTHRIALLILSVLALSAAAEHSMQPHNWITLSARHWQPRHLRAGTEQLQMTGPRG